MGYSALMKQSPLVRLLVMTLINFVVMFFLMYAMTDVLENVMFNINKVYMAALMSFPMIIIEGWIMGSMYPSKKALAALMGASGLAVVIVFIFIRNQVGVGDTQFLRSMIPHHSSAILMCQQANLEDQEIKDLCDAIVAIQEEEIRQMQEIMQRQAVR